jgi:DNA-binding NarL/FixJ family response regulator
MQILIVEDDHNQSEWIRMTLEQNFHEIKIDYIKTEHEFRTRVDELVKAPPDVIIMDIMLRWAKPSPRVPPRPMDVRAEGFYFAGLRCEELLAEKLKENGTPHNTPVILYTVLDPIELHPRLQNLRPNVTYLRKKQDSKQLVQKIKNIVSKTDKPR